MGILVAIALLALTTVLINVETETNRRDKHPRILYHYTPYDNLLGIRDTMELRASIKDDSDPHSDAQWGDGQYFTDLPPDDAGRGSMFQLARALFDHPFHWGGVRIRIAYIGVDTQDLPMFRARTLFSNTYGSYWIYVHLSPTSLSLAGRIFDFGEVNFAK